jgi:hypothetical protein
MRKLDKYLLILLLLFIGCIICLIFWENNNTELVTEDQLISRMFKCPEYYSTEGERSQDLDRWMYFFMNKYPDANLDEIMSLRYDFLVKNNCTETLQNIAKNEEHSAEVERQEMIKSVTGGNKSKL